MEKFLSATSPSPAATLTKDPDEKRFGKLTNPTVHMGLNQLRRLVNRLVSCYGEPAQIVVELARELKLSKQQKDEERKRNANNRNGERS
jgi:CRISPR-associated endonuclease Csn1